MKTSNIIIVTLFCSFTLSKMLACEAEFPSIIKSIGVVMDVFMDPEDLLKSLLDDDDNKIIEMLDKEDKKLDNITMKIESLEKEMTHHFKELFSAVSVIPNEVTHGQIAVTFENSMQSIGSILRQLISKKKGVESGRLRVNDQYFASEMSNYIYKLDNFKEEFEVIMNGKDYSHDFLVLVKDRANVCEDNMSQMQLLDSFRALYVDTIRRYLLARHIIIWLSERAHQTRYDDKKLELNMEERESLVPHAKRFQALMVNSSREYQFCLAPAPSSLYFLVANPLWHKQCSLKSEGDLSQPNADNLIKNKLCNLLSLRPVMARPGYVVVGASIARNENILYVKIVEGKLLPNGIVDPTSITHNDDPPPGVGEEMGIFSIERSRLDVTETIAPDNRVITGLKFSRTDKQHYYLDILTSEIDLESGTLLRNTSRSEPHKKGLENFNLRRFKQTGAPVIRNRVGLESVKPNQFLRFIPGSESKAHPAIVLGDIYPTPLTLLSGASLYVRQVHNTEGYLSIRLHTFNIAPHGAKINFDVNEDFGDVLKSIH